MIDWDEFGQQPAVAASAQFFITQFHLPVIQMDG